MRVFETIEAWGHSNISANHKTTFEITRMTHVTHRGDCVVAVNASKGARNLSGLFKQMAKRSDATIVVAIAAGCQRDTVTGRGHSQLHLNHPTDLVVRKSDYVCDRTLMIGANKAAADLSRSLITALQNPSQRIVVSVMIVV